MYNKVLIFFFLFAIHHVPLLLQAASWKSSLNFHLDGKLFENDGIHIGMSKRVQQKVEEYPETARVKIGGLYQNVPVTYDNVGNIFFEDKRLFFDPSYLLAPTNKTNFALASLEVILKDFEGVFYRDSVELNDWFDGGVPTLTPFFSSAPSKLTGDAYRRLEIRMRSDNLLKPNSFDGDDFSIYHPKAHSEDKIFYVVSREYRKIIDAIKAKEENAGKNIRAVVLHIHTRFDMCGSCAYSLDWELKDGFGRDIFKYCRKLNKNKSLVSVGALVSSRQEYLVWGPSRRTLPVPPLVRTAGISDKELRDEYERTIAFDSDLDGPKTFSQMLIKPFI